jgi:hypothetical protein
MGQIISTFFALAISCATGWFTLELAWPRVRRAPGDLALRLAASAGLGLFASSMVYLLCLALGVASRPWVIGIDIALLAGLAAWVYRARREPGQDQSHGYEPFAVIDWILGGAVSLALAINASAWLQRFRDEPLGFWDAFAIWNVKARFFFFDAGEHWQRAFSNTIAWSHTDYPLLLPLNVARLWTYGGTADQGISALLSVVFSMLAIGLVFGAVAQAKGRPMAFLASLALLASPQFMAQSTWQVSDIPTGAFLAGSFALILAAARNTGDRNALLVLAGVAAGAAAWTKNEGVLFAVAMPVALAVVGPVASLRERLTEVFQFAKGLAPPLALLLVIKLFVTGESDLAADLGFSSLSRVFEWSRHQMIIASFFKLTVMLAGLPLLGLLLGLSVYSRFASATAESRWQAALALALTLQLAGYYFIYVITERDLAWHLGTSNLRLLIQLWPSTLLLLFTALNRFDPATPADR